MHYVKFIISAAKCHQVKARRNYLAYTLAYVRREVKRHGAVPVFLIRFYARMFGAGKRASKYVAYFIDKFASSYGMIHKTVQFPVPFSDQQLTFDCLVIGK